MTEEERKAKNREYAKKWREKNPTYSKEWFAAHPNYQSNYLQRNPHFSRDWRLKKHFKLTRAEYNEMLAVQNHQCAICQKTFQGTGNDKACVDHDHETDAVRGILCGGCNKGLGLLKDDIAVLQAAIAYLEKYRQ